MSLCHNNVIITKTNIALRDIKRVRKLGFDVLMIIEFLVAQTVRTADAITQASFIYPLLFRRFCLLTIVDRSTPTYKLQQKLVKIKMQN